MAENKNDLSDQIDKALDTLGDRQAFLEGYAAGKQEADNEAKLKQERLDQVTPGLRADFERAVTEMVNTHPGMTPQDALNFLLNVSHMTPWEPLEEFGFEEQSPLKKIIDPESLPGRDAIISSTLTKLRYETPYKQRAWATKEHAQKMRDKLEALAEASDTQDRKRIERELEADRVLVQYQVLYEQAKAEVLYWSRMFKRAEEVLRWKEAEPYKKASAPKWFIDAIKRGDEAEKEWRGASKPTVESAPNPEMFQRVQPTKLEQHLIDQDLANRKPPLREWILPDGTSVFAREKPEPPKEHEYQEED